METISDVIARLEKERWLLHKCDVQWLLGFDDPEEAYREFYAESGSDWREEALTDAQRNI